MCTQHSWGHLEYKKTCPRLLPDPSGLSRYIVLYSNPNIHFHLCCLNIQSGSKLLINGAGFCCGLIRVSVFVKTAWQQSANFEVDSIPFSGEPSDASGLLERHSHPLRQTLINLCVQVWISQLNLWHTALPERCLYKCPPLLTDKGSIKTRLAVGHCLPVLVLLEESSGLRAQKALQQGQNQALELSNWRPRASW